MKTPIQLLDANDASPMVFLLATLIFVLTAATAPCQNQRQQDSDLELNYSIGTKDPSAMTHTLWGALVEDLSALVIEPDMYRKLDALTTTDDGLLKLLNRLNNRNDALAIAVFLNQKYPDKLFNPTGSGFSPLPTSPIPVALCVEGRIEHVHVFPETFGQICYAYWSRELRIGEFKRAAIPQDEPKKE